MPSELLQQGVGLMLLGMGVVFVLLGLLVLALMAMSRLARMLEPPPVVVDTAGVAAAPEMDDPELIGVITAAVRANRGQSQR